MQPFILDGDALEIAPTSKRLGHCCGATLLVKVNDEKLVAHRIIKSSSTGGKTTYLID